ncbi:MAG: bifunctional phosphoserine phosphatase/homoserine phosphotransferase ThrH [Spirochaetota bacterium]|jgi:phosphoserine/homoserine phosphotransferase|nr:bifunctional phosphoserine phosphatase/homoserine phosphotransferase ThrH [Spirochaetota bacterium]
MDTVCLDMEGVLFPEIWISVAERMGIPELRRTTRDEPDYDVLMRYRMDILYRKGITLAAIQEVIAALRPLNGAEDFMRRLRTRFQVLILSDTFYQFAMPLVSQIGYPVIFCHALLSDSRGMISGYRLRQPEAKRAVVCAFREQLKMRVIAMGDSYNDTAMLQAADQGVLFCPPQNVIDEFPQFPVARTYPEAESLFEAASARFTE